MSGSAKTVGLLSSVFIVGIISVFIFDVGDFSKNGSRFISSVDGKKKVADFTKAIKNEYFFTVSPDLEVKGPIHELEKNAQYFKRIFGLIIQVADEKARKDWFLDGDSNQSYFTFLLGSLVVPYHESYWISFRKRQNEIIIEKEKEITFCDSGANDFSKLKKKFPPEKLQSKNRVVRNLAKYVKWTFGFLHGHYRENFPPCDTFSEGEDIVQFMSSGFYVDMGLMQLNAKAHPSIYLNNDIFNTVKTIRYGLDYYYRGFNKFILRYDESSEGDKIRCLGRNGSLDYFNLMMGAWSGYYNSGPSGDACRFCNSINCAKTVVADNKINWYSWFKKEKDDFLKILSTYENTGKRIEPTDWRCDYMKNDMSMLKDGMFVWYWDKAHFFKYLPKDSLEYKALKEIQKNFINKKSETHYLNMVLKTDYTAPELDEPGPSQGEIEKELDTIVKNSEKTFFENIVVENKDEMQHDDQEGVLPLIQEEEIDYIVTAINVNIRNGAGMSFKKCGNTWGAYENPLRIKVVGELNKYKIVLPWNLKSTIYDKSSECLDQEFYYIHRDLVQVVEKYDIDSIGHIKLGAVLRSRVEFPSKIVATANRGERVLIIDRTTSEHGQVWYEILTSEGLRGWAIEDYIAMSSEDVESPPEKNEVIDFDSIISSDVAIRAGPGASRAKTGKAFRRGTRIRILDEKLIAGKYHWYSVLAESGVSGWVYKHVERL